MAAPRNTTRRDRHRKIVARGNPPCRLCGQPIDYAAHHLEPHSFTIHHVIPLNRGGVDELFDEHGNDQIVAAHRLCNREQGDRLPGEPPASKRARSTVPRQPVSYSTDRQW